MTENKIILPESSEAATLKAVTGWVSRSGHFYGDNEKLARWDGSTHRQCKNESHPPFIKNSYCELCRKEAQDKKFNSMPFSEYGGGFVYCHNNDKFYDSLDYFFEDVEDGSLDSHLVGELWVSNCEPQAMHEVDASHWEEVLPDGEHDYIPQEVQDALESLNAAIREYGQAVSWVSKDDRIDVEGMNND